MQTVNSCYGRNQPWGSACARRSSRLLLVATGISLCFSPGALGQTSDSQTDDSNKSWTATTDSKADYANPTRTFQSHTQSSDGTVDVRSLKIQGSDGSLNPYQDVETKTFRVNDTTTQTTTRTFVRDGNGEKTIFQITEEERQTFPGGNSKVLRTTSNPDANGNLQVVRREVQETVRNSPDVEETKTTVMLPNVDGNLAPAMKTQEQQTRSGDKVEIQETTLMSDGSGNWQVGETRQVKIEDEGKNRSKEERVSRPNFDGKLSEVSRTVSKESEDPSGGRRNSEATYSIDVPGVGRDSSLHLVQRVTSTQRTDSGSQQTTKLVERSNPGDPDAGLRISIVTADIVRFGPSGAEATRTIQERDTSGSLGVVSVDMTKSDNAHAIEVQIAPSTPK
jgi:hypothetical protein